MKSKPKPATDARSAVTGKFVTPAEAKRRPNETVVTRRKGQPERVPCWAIRHRDGDVIANSDWSRTYARNARNWQTRPSEWRVVKVYVEMAND